VVIYILRIPVIKFSISEDLPTIDLTIMSTMVPKGLAAAVLANLPLQAGVPGGEMIRDLVYAVILTSIVLTSLLIPVLKRVPAVSAFYGAIIRTGRKTRRAPVAKQNPLHQNEQEKSLSEE
jgi:putative Na+/H+ antiporter